MQRGLYLLETFLILKIRGLYSRAVSNQERVMMARVWYIFVCFFFENVFLENEVYEGTKNLKLASSAEVVIFLQAAIGRIQGHSIWRCFISH